MILVMLPLPPIRPISAHGSALDWSAGAWGARDKPFAPTIRFETGMFRSKFVHPSLLTQKETGFVDSSVLTGAKIDADTKLAHYWSKAERAGLEIKLLAPTSIASMLSRKGKSRELTQAINKLHQIRLADGPESSGNGKLAFLGTGPGAWLAVWSTHSPRNIDLLCIETRNLASIADQSSAYRIFTISGTPTKALLARGLTMNIAEPEFKTGSVVVSFISHIGTIVWQTNDRPEVMIAVANSCCESFCHWISEALLGVIQEARQEARVASGNNT